MGLHVGGTERLETGAGEKRLLDLVDERPLGALDERVGDAVARALGQTGIDIMTRLMGLILAALAVELLADGLQKLFPLLANSIR